VRRLVSFDHRPWPTWTYQIDSERTIVHEVTCEPSSGQVVVSWRLVGSGALELVIRPLLCARDYHSLQRENSGFRFDAISTGDNVAWHPYPDRPGITALTNGCYRHDPTWYRQFSYDMERQRGLDHLEDLASPGAIRFALRDGSPAVVVLAAGIAPFGDAVGVAENLRGLERERRGRLSDPLLRAADAYLVRRGDGLTVVAGYPWFTDWGRDTFISLRGLCLAGGRVDDARRVLLAWAESVSRGMLPNRFTDAGSEAEYNSVDASLWYAVVVGELLAATQLPEAERGMLGGAVLAILHGYGGGTRYGIRVDGDGLLAAGTPGVQLTWMDAKIGDRVITPRIGKPVEIQALWINALAVGERFDRGLTRWRELATASFAARFPRGDGALYDVVDADHVAGKNDASFRPNQVFAAGGLPLAMLEGTAARALVDAVEQRLWTPVGLRSLDATDPAYCARCEGGVIDRDQAYHQGTVWTWLAGPFVDAWLRCRGNSRAAKAEARRRFFGPLLAQLDVAGLGHLSEIADAEPPHAPRGAPFQAWSIAELIRIRKLVGDDP
jgi:predicted glycogen debranching enzyme